MRKHKINDKEKRRQEVKQEVKQEARQRQGRGMLGSESNDLSK